MMIKVNYDSYILLGTRPGDMTQIICGWERLPAMVKVNEMMALWQHMGPVEGFCLVRPSNIMAPLTLKNKPTDPKQESDAIVFPHNDNMEMHMLDQHGNILLWRVENSRQKGDLLSVTLRRK